MSRIPHSRNFRTTSTARARTVNNGNFTGRTGNDSRRGPGPASSSVGTLIFWLALVLAAWLLFSYPLATIGTVITLGAALAYFSRK